MQNESLFTISRSTTPTNAANYDRLPNGNYEVSYGTTADFEYCPVCGSFQTVTEAELMRLIDSVETENDPDLWVEYK